MVQPSRKGAKYKLKVLTPAMVARLEFVLYKPPMPPGETMYSNVGRVLYGTRAANYGDRGKPERQE
ncbi:hypothetical protein MTHERMOG20_05630 [Moorella thermoacetica]|nr:hypothetical protein MTHERMOG20_05630 [Moorella thermoacetica]